MKSPAVPRKVLLAEFNEITWRLVEPLVERGHLPTFAEFLRTGVRGSPMALEVPPHLDPWISWTTVYTGRPREEHGAQFLEQPPETVLGPRVWEIAAAAGKTLGIFGSIMSWPPPKEVRGFYVPGTFSPGPETAPPDLQPIQELNLTHARAHTPRGSDAKRFGLLQRGLQLRKLGLKLSTMARVAAFLLRSRLWRHRMWEKVSLQPIVNLDFFETLYGEYQPDLATFHTNHVAHYQHRFWRAFDPAPFAVKPSAEEVRKYGPAIAYGYRVLDRVLARLWRLSDDNTVVIIASGLGQQPYVVEEFPEGRPIVRVKDINQIMALCGVSNGCIALSMMAPQWNFRIADPALRARAVQVLRSAWVGPPQTPLFYLDTIGDTINFNVCQKIFKPWDPKAVCVFPDAGGQSFQLGDLCATDDATPKEGYHERAGLVILRGAGIRQGGHLEACTNLDLAPTMLHLLGLPIPSYMKGRVLEEALERPRTLAVV